MAAKQILFDDAARQKLTTGVNKLANAVVATLGPRASNVAVDKSFGPPVVLHDGVSVAKEIQLEDPFENMGAQLVKEAAQKTNDIAGDGTTTATLLAQQFVVKGMRNITAGTNPMMLRKGIDIAVQRVLAELDAMAIPVKEEEWVKVATISAQDPVIGEKIAEALKLVGAGGIVEVEEGKTMDITIEHTEGMEFDKGYASPYFVTDTEHMEAVIEDPYILITDQKISSIQDLLPFLEGFMKVSKNLVIIADDIEGEALTTLVLNKLRGVFNVLAVKAPGFGDRRKAMLEDIAVLTGGTVISADMGRKLDSATIEDTGRASTVRSTKDNTFVIGGKGAKADLDARVSQIEAQIKASTSDFDKEKLEERKAKLSAGVAVIQVGAATETQLKELQERVKDAKEATKAAIEEGVIPGGGVSYLQALKALDGLTDADPDVQAGIHLVAETLRMPVQILAENSGQDGGWVVRKLMESKTKNYGFNAQTLEFGDMLKMGVIDPKKVAKYALINSSSIAGEILSSRVLITDVKEDKPAMPMGGGMPDMGGMM
jgi:chaperonin GroEL